MIVQEYCMLILWFLKFYEILNYVHEHWKKNQKNLFLIIQNLVIFLHTSVETTEQCHKLGPKWLMCPNISKMKLFWYTNEAILLYCDIGLALDFQPM